jgi:hypothetical protein
MFSAPIAIKAAFAEPHSSAQYPSGNFWIEMPFISQWDGPWGNVQMRDVLPMEFIDKTYTDCGCGYSDLSMIMQFYGFGMSDYHGLPPTPEGIDVFMSLAGAKYECKSAGCNGLGFNWEALGNWDSGFTFKPDGSAIRYWAGLEVDKACMASEAQCVDMATEWLEVRHEPVILGLLVPPKLPADWPAGAPPENCIPGSDTPDGYSAHYVVAAGWHGNPAWNPGTFLVFDSDQGRADYWDDSGPLTYTPYYGLLAQPVLSLDDIYYGRCGVEPGALNIIEAVIAFKRKTGNARTAILSFAGCSPVELVVTDPNGMKTGYDPVSDQYFAEGDGSYAVVGEDNLDGSTHNGFASVVTFNNPPEGQYAIKAVGTGEGAYDIVSSEAGVLHSGTITTGEEVSIQTSLPLPPVVSTLPPSDLTQTTITCAADVDSMGTTEAWFEWGTSADYSVYQSTARVSVQPAGPDNVVSIALANLQPDTEYFYRAVAENGGGQSKGEIVRTATLPVIPPTVSTRPVTDLLPQQATLHGTLNPEAFETTYWFEWSAGQDLSVVSSTPEVVVPAGNTNLDVNHVLTGLAVSTGYSFRLVARNAGGTSPGDVVTFTTQAPRPAAVNTDPADEIFTWAANLNGGVNPNGVVTSAWFEWGSDPLLLNANVTERQEMGAGTVQLPLTLQIDGLSPLSDYYFRAVSENVAGINAGEVVSFSTPEERLVLTINGGVDGASNIMFVSNPVDGFTGEWTFGPSRFYCTWDWGDGSITEGDYWGSPYVYGQTCWNYHVYDASGQYVVTLTVEDGDTGRTFTATEEVEVLPVPVLTRGKLHWDHNVDVFSEITQDFSAKVLNPSNRELLIRLDTVVDVPRTYEDDIVQPTFTLVPGELAVKNFNYEPRPYEGRHCFTSTLVYGFDTNDDGILQGVRAGVPLGSEVLGGSTSKSGCFNLNRK